MPEIVVVAIRSVVTYLFLLLATRLAGRKLLSQLTAFDFIVAITIGSMASTAAIDVEERPTDALLAIAAWIGLVVLTGYLTNKSLLLRKVVNAEPMPVIREGKILERNLGLARLSVDQLLALLREKHVFNLSEVQYAWLETDGKVSILRHSDRESLTPRAAGIAVAPHQVPHLLISDGKVLKDTLRSLGYDESWLKSRLAEQGVARVDQVFVAQLDTSGHLYLDLYEDERALLPVDRKALVTANLRRVAADLNLYSLETEDEEAASTYRSLRERTDRLLASLSPYLK